jgi:hypothetical protein
MIECDEAILREMRKFETKAALSNEPLQEKRQGAEKGLGKKKKRKARRNEPTFDCQKRSCTESPALT